MEKLAHILIWDGILSLLYTLQNNAKLNFESNSTFSYLCEKLVIQKCGVFFFFPFLAE